MKTIQRLAFYIVMKLHWRWVAGRWGGVRLDFTNRNLYACLARRTDFSNMEAQHATFNGANLFSATFHAANMKHADISEADLGDK